MEPQPQKKNQNVREITENWWKGRGMGYTDIGMRERYIFKAKLRWMMKFMLKRDCCVSCLNKKCMDKNTRILIPLSGKLHRS